MPAELLECFDTAIYVQFSVENNVSYTSILATHLPSWSHTACTFIEWYPFLLTNAGSPSEGA